MRKLLPLVFLLLLLPTVSLAAGKLTSFYVSPSSAESADDLSAVSWYKKGTGKYCLYLPSGWDTTSLRVWFTGPDFLTIDGTKVLPGDTVSCFVGGTTVKVKNGSGSFRVQVLQSRNIPTVFLTTESGSLTFIEKSKSNREAGQVLIQDAEGGEVTQQPMSRINCRGNSSFKLAEKKSYTLKLESGKNLFGMGKSKTWLLCGTPRDRSMLRNKICYAMADYAGLDYTPELIHVNLYINHEYRGVYLLTEKYQISSARIDIDDLESSTEAVNELPLDHYPQLGSKTAKKGSGKYFDIPNDPSDITGGYLIEFKIFESSYDDQSSAYYTRQSNLIDFISPEYLSEAQYTYITGLIQSFENAIMDADGLDPDTGRHYTEIADLHSLVYKYLLEEVVKNRDANMTSCFFYKPADSVSTKLFAGPCWDYDSAFGSYANESEQSKGLLKATGFWVNRQTRNDSVAWFPQLYLHSDFQEAVRLGWSDTYAHALAILLGEETDPQGRLLSLDEYEAMLTDAMAMNDSRWPIKNTSSTLGTRGKDFAANVTLLKNYISERRDWLEQQWGN